jgi:hypothetical protein
MITKDTREGYAWIAKMDSSVSRQKAVLNLLLERVASDVLYRYLVIGCSLAREAGDALSDIDAGVGIADDAWPEGVERVIQHLRGLMPVVDQQNQVFPDSSGRIQRHLITVYEDNLQLSLVVAPASWLKGLKPDTVALYDPHNQLSNPWDPPVKVTTPDKAREWAFLAWLNLADAGKYIARGSLWEAYERLHRARNHTWQLWAVAHRLDFALYGITQILDDDVPLPEGMEKTSAVLESKALHAACLALADITDEAMHLAHNVLPFELPIGMAQTARNQLKSIES